MQINAINSIKPSFKSNSNPMSQQDDEVLADLQTLFEATDTLNLTSKNPKEGKKNIAEIALSAAGAVLVTFAACKGISKSAEKIFPGTYDKLANGLSNLANKAGNKAKEINIETKTGKIKSVVLQNVQKAYNALSKNGTKEGAANLMGIAGATVLAPEIMTVDGNDDGVADITQKGANMYQGAIEKMGALNTVLSVLS